MEEPVEEEETASGSENDILKPMETVYCSYLAS